MNGAFSIVGLLVRTGLALALVVATFNPSGYSLSHWLVQPPVAITPGKALAALLLVIGWTVCLRTAFIALGKIGVLLALGLFATILWLLVDRKVLSPTGVAIVWASLVVVGILLGVGLSWSLLRAKVTGQIEAR